MEAHDWWLGALEGCLVAASVVSLLRAKSGRARTSAALLALGVALTLAHPFGMKAERVGRAPSDAAERNPTGRHTARILGLPIVPFALYRRDKPVAENVPVATLRARSWLWPFLFTNASEVTPLCGDLSTPCWPDRSARDGSGADRLSLVSSGGDFWVRVDNREKTGPGSSIPAEFVFRIGPGVTSWWGLGYWLAAGIVLVRFNTARPGDPERGVTPTARGT